MFTNWTSLARTFALRRQLFGDIITKSISTTASTTNIFTNWKNNSFNSNASNWSRSNRNYNERALSTLQTKITLEMASKEEYSEFMAVFSDIVKTLTDAGKNSDIPEAYDWYAKLLHENVPNGTKFRGLAIVALYKMLEDPKNLTPENIKLANILGWCIEVLQASMLIVDDIIDGSETRRGTSCWYKRVGLNAINDSQLIENGTFTLLKAYFSHLPMYVPTMELIHDITQKTCMGQALDSLCLKDGRPNFETFTMKTYNSNAKYKTYYYSFHLPVALGLFLANKFDLENYREANMILLELGNFLQVQNDYLDCYGNPEKTGKIGTDIQAGKCVWPVVVALQKATPSQRKVIEENYGKEDPAAISTIRNLYDELELANTYAIYKEDTLNLIRTQIKQITDLPQAMFFKFLDEVYKREH